MSYIEHTSSHYVEMNQNTVDLYLMKNGKPIWLTDRATMEIRTCMRFRDRDPRLYQSKIWKRRLSLWSYTDNPADRDILILWGANESCSNPVLV